MQFGHFLVRCSSGHGAPRAVESTHALSTNNSINRSRFIMELNLITASGQDGKWTFQAQALPRRGLEQTCLPDFCQRLFLGLMQIRRVFTKVGGGEVGHVWRLTREFLKYSENGGQRRRAIEALEARVLPSSRHYCDCMWLVVHRTE